MSSLVLAAHIVCSANSMYWDNLLQICTQISDPARIRKIGIRSGANPPYNECISIIYDYFIGAVMRNIKKIYFILSPFGAKYAQFIFIDHYHDSNQYDVLKFAIFLSSPNSIKFVLNTWIFFFMFFLKRKVPLRSHRGVKSTLATLVNVRES